MPNTVNDIIQMKSREKITVLTTVPILIALKSMRS